jgi:hemin uptake protein HemP
MKFFALAAASLLLLSAVWVGAENSSDPSVYAGAAAPKTRTPKPTRDSATKTPREKPTKAAKPKKTNFSGEVLEVSEASLSIQTNSGETVSFLVTADTSVKIPTLPHATPMDIAVGARVLVQALEGEDGSLTALKITVSPGKPAPKHHVGVVTAYEPGASITIRAHDGNEYTFRITEETKILPTERAEELAVGRTVTVISPRDVTGGPFTAAGIVVHPEEAGGETEGAPTATATPTATPTPTPTETPTPESPPASAAA